MNAVIINPPNTDKDTYMARTADRWPHRVKRGKLFKAKMFPKYPLYLMYGAAMMEKAGISVNVIDATERDYSINETLNVINEFDPKPEVFFIEVSTPSFDSDIKFISTLKQKYENSHISILGPHATVFHKEILQEYQVVDSVIRGEFITIMNDICLAHVAGSLKDVLGITYRNGNEIVENASKPFIGNLNDLEWPARHLLDPRRYRMGHYTYEPQLLMMTSMGCPSKCIFCIWPQLLYDQKIRLRDPEDIADEMIFCRKQYGAREIYFDDDTFNITEERVMKLCETFIRKKTKLSWITEMRCDKVSLDMYKTMKRAGCVKVLYGVESGNQEILDNCKKDIKVEQVKNAFALTHKAGIRSHAAFMFGLPGESKNTINDTMKFARRLKADTIQCSIALPYPGTEFYRIAKESGTLKVDKWTDYDSELCGAIEYPGLSKAYIQDSIGKMYKQFYIRPSYLMYRVASMRSWSDVTRFYDQAIGYFRRFS